MNRSGRNWYPVKLPTLSWITEGTVRHNRRGYEPRNWLPTYCETQAWISYWLGGGLRFGIGRTGVFRSVLDIPARTRGWSKQVRFGNDHGACDIHLLPETALATEEEHGKRHEETKEYDSTHSSPNYNLDFFG